MNKKLIFFMLGLVLMGLFITACEQAKPGETTKSFTQTVKDVEILKFMAVDFAAAVQDPAHADHAAGLIIARILLAFLVFVILFGASTYVPVISKFEKNHRIGITAIIAIIAGAVIPRDTIITMVQGLGAILVLIPLIIMIVVGYYGLFKWADKDDRTGYATRIFYSLMLIFATNGTRKVLGGLVEKEGWGVLSWAITLAWIVMVVTIFYMFYCLYVAVAGVSKGAGAKAKYLPAPIKRALRRAGRWAYKMERIEETIIGDLEAQQGHITDKVNPKINQIKSSAVGEDAKRTNAGKVETEMGPIKDRLKDLMDNHISKRLDSWALDVDILAKKVGDENLITESHGMLAEIKDIIKKMEAAHKAAENLEATTASLKADGSDVATLSEAAVNQHVLLKDNLKAVIEGVKKMNVLTKDVLKKAAQKKIELPEA